MAPVCRRVLFTVWSCAAIAQAKWRRGRRAGSSKTVQVTERKLTKANRRLSKSAPSPKSTKRSIKERARLFCSRTTGDIAWGGYELLLIKSRFPQCVDKQCFPARLVDFSPSLQSALLFFHAAGKCVLFRLVSPPLLNFGH